jgi:predicted amidophosphoribosyltransferase
MLLPERCAVCACPGSRLCGICRGALIRLGPPVCERCGAPGPWPVLRCAECSGRRLAFARARAAIVYEERARTFVREWKERGRRRLSVDAASLVAEVVASPETDVLTFVPGDPERALRRGDVAPKGLAIALGKLWGMPVAELLRRGRSLPRQRGLTLAERRGNVRGAFGAVASASGLVSLVDDVYTSGATADACAAALKRAGARRVEVVTLARAVR